MASWVAADGWSGYFADCGPFTGTWPPAPPIPDNLPAAASELDYYFSTYSMADVINFADSGSLDLYRYRNTSTTTQANSGIGKELIAGANLYLIYYPSDGYPGTAPTMDPLSLVPPSYAAGATGAAVGNFTTGQWSPWQPSFTYTQAADRTPKGASRTAVEGANIGAPGQADGWPDTQTLGASLTQQAASGTGSEVQDSGDFATSTSGGSDFVDPGAIYQMWLRDDSNTTGVYIERHYGQVDVHQALVLVQAALTQYGYATTPPPLNGQLIEGLDYGQPPAGTVPAGTYWQLASDNATFSGWESTTISVTFTMDAYLYGDSLSGTSNVTHPTFHVRFAITDYALGSSTSWPEGSYGTELGVASSSTDGEAQTLTYSLAGVTGNQLGILAQPGVVTGADGWPFTYSLPDPPNLGNYRQDFQTHLSGQLTVTAVYTVPQWRYWMPGTAVPLRLTQRTDGIGVVKHARIRSTGQVTSAQFRTTARINVNNQYR